MFHTMSPSTKSNPFILLSHHGGESEDSDWDTGKPPLTYVYARRQSKNELAANSVKNN